MNESKVLSDVGPSWCKFLPDVERWAAELAVLAKADLQGRISASVWPYRDNGDKGCEMLSVDMVGSEGGDLSITFGTGYVSRTDYDFNNLAGNTCFQVPDLTEAFSLAAVLLDKLSATVTLPNRS
jgi:hypothetical protein